jgi:hypothetical protein
MKNFLFIIFILMPLTNAYSYIDLTKSEMTAEKFDSILALHPEATELGDVPALLPEEFRLNFVLKHGILRIGERGHLVEKVVSQSSSPTSPRAIVWDERSGMVMSWNGGAPDQLALNRIDLLNFDKEKKVFSLRGADFPISEGKAHYSSEKCTTCHGPDQRPIFGMYPDWPSFYGSDNDELLDMNKASQVAEKKDYDFFLKNIVPSSERYTSLFNKDNIEKNLGVSLYDTFPFRQDLGGNTDGNLNAISRSFAFRPALRLGILLNRLQSQHVAKRIEDHKNYKQYGPYFLHELLECRWPSNAILSQRNQYAKSKNFKAAVAKTLGEELKTISGTLNYRQLLKLFDLRVNDVDIRYSYNHEGYNNEDANQKVMEIGYVNSFWNSYFDGSATIDELVSYQLYTNLIEAGYKSLAGVIVPDGLEVKYQKRAARYAFDKNFFQEMDRKGKWIPIPYPPQLTDVHHREGYPTRFSDQHKNLCQKLEAIILK